MNSIDGEREKYAMYIDAIRDHPEVLEYFIRNIDQSPDKEIIVKVADVKKELFPAFKDLLELDVYWGLEFALSTKGINVSATKLRDINPETGQEYLLLKLRKIAPGEQSSRNLEIYTKETLDNKMQKTLEIICTLYKRDTITDAYIVGSFAKSIIENVPFKDTSDIDILILNPFFESPSCELIPEDIVRPIQGKVIMALQEIGASFKNITLPVSKQFPDISPEDYLYFSYVIYKNDIFHVMPFWTKEDIIQMGMTSVHIPISKNDCKNFLTIFQTKKEYIE